ncbi:MAG: DUF3052 domain-containing protein [Bacteroidetes bacterium]|nr:DUF3052 domain-containing protein [Bacteroidota bacterium]
MFTIISDPEPGSPKPLSEKLGIRSGFTVLLINPPESIRTDLNPLPPDVNLAEDEVVNPDLVIFFAEDQADTAFFLSRIRETYPDILPVWVAWKKNSGKVAGYLTENQIREVALPLGFVDNKVCSLNRQWSALRLTVRKKLRKTRAGN